MAKPLTNRLLAAALSRSAGIECDALQAAGVSQDVLHEVESRNDLKDLGFHSITRIAAAMAGRPVSNLAGPQDLANTWSDLMASSQLMATGANVNLKVLVDDAINMTVAARYQAFPSVIPFVAAQPETKDFRPINNYVITGGGFLQRVAESGELNHLRMSDSKLSIEPDTSGGFLTIPRKLIVNDSVGVIGTIGDLLGFKGAQTLERDFHRMLLEPTNWSTSKSVSAPETWEAGTNRFTGAGTAFNYSALQIVHEVWSNQLDSEGMPISCGPNVLLVQAGKMALDAKDINKSEKVMVRSDNTIDRTEANVFQGMLGDVVETQWLRHASMNQSHLAAPRATQKAWFQFCTPKIRAAFAVCFLTGKKVPTVETAAAPFNSLGTQMRVTFDYGMGRVDSVGAIRMDGE